LLAAIAEQFQTQVSELNAQNLANTAWAFATVEIHDMPFFNFIAEQAHNQIRHFGPQSLSNTAWAFATIV